MKAANDYQISDEHSIFVIVLQRLMIIKIILVTSIHHAQSDFMFNISGQKPVYSFSILHRAMIIQIVLVTLICHAKSNILFNISGQ